MIGLESKIAYRLTGFVFLILGILFFLRDIKINLIGETQGWTLILVLVGAGLVAGGGQIVQDPATTPKRPSR